MTQFANMVRHFFYRVDCAWGRLVCCNVPARNADDPWGGTYECPNCGRRHAV